MVRAATEVLAFYRPTLRRRSTISPGLVAVAGRNIARRNMRTYSLTSRESLSALRITHVLKHNDGSESGFTTTVRKYKDAVLRMRY